MSDQNDIDVIEAWFFSLEPEYRQCTHCGEYISRSEAEDHFQGQCKEELKAG